MTYLCKSTLNGTELNSDMYPCMFQDTNEAEAENTDKESDFNLKVSRRFIVFVVSPLFIFRLVFARTLDEPFEKTAK